MPLSHKEEKAQDMRTCGTGKNSTKREVCSNTYLLAGKKSMLKGAVSHLEKPDKEEQRTFSE